jgi:hypothetical protein
MNRPALSAARSRRNSAALGSALALAGLALAVYVLTYFLTL